MRIPPKFQGLIQPNMSIQWAGKRVFYEVIEEWTDSIFWIITLYSFAYYISQFVKINQFFLIGLFIGTLICLLPAILETKRWENEIYVVCKDDYSDGGMVYKFTGILNGKKLEVPVTGKGPAVTTDEYTNNVIYWFFKKTTGYRMQKVYLKSETNAVLDGRRISPSFARAISEVKGSSTKKLEVMTPLWVDVDGLSRAVNSDLLEKEYARTLIKLMLEGRLNV